MKEWILNKFFTKEINQIISNYEAEKKRQAKSAHENMIKIKEVEKRKSESWGKNCCYPIYENHSKMGIGGSCLICRDRRIATEMYCYIMKLFNRIEGKSRRTPKDWEPIFKQLHDLKIITSGISVYL